MKNYCLGTNILIIENCTFSHNIVTYITEIIPVMIRPLIEIILSHDGKSVSFKKCSFKRNYNDNHLISIHVVTSKFCYDKTPPCISSLTRITFVGCRFTKNIGELMNIKGSCRAKVLIIGPSHFTNTAPHTHIGSNLITIYYMSVHLIGPITIISNNARNMLHFDSCEIKFYNNIMIKSNNCGQVITLRFTCIKVMEYTNITLLKNKYLNKLIEIEYDNKYKLYPMCIFQFVTVKNTTTVSPTHYSINFINNYVTYLYVPEDIRQEKKCSFPFYHFTPHCQWIKNTVFYSDNPSSVYRHIIRIYGQNLTYHKICHCFQNGNFNCNVDTLGPVYPGQMLQVELCTPCYDEPSILYAEVNSIHLPNLACKVAPHDETNLYTIILK